MLWYVSSLLSSNAFWPFACRFDGAAAAASTTLTPCSSLGHIGKSAPVVIAAHLALAFGGALDFTPHATAATGAFGLAFTPNSRLLDSLCLPTSRHGRT